MTNSEKLLLLNRLKLKFMAAAEEEGDAHPCLQVEIIDTDPEPMSGPYVQVCLSLKVLLPES